VSDPIALPPHPLLDAGLFETRLPGPLSTLPSPDWLQRLLAADADVPFRADDKIRSAVRALLRHGGFKPSGRSKPASEYLERAVADGSLSSINAVVDVCNVVSLHAGLPISVVDLDRAQEPFRIDVAGSNSEYVFNATGQVIDLEGLLCLYDAEGPCANAVKDCQRTKTHAGTLRTLSVVWSHRDLSGYVQAVTRWYEDLLQRLGADTVRRSGVGAEIAKS
jgi:DNA/RNA-binding domain of Phe-tRNA-synthetase-like protein